MTVPKMLETFIDGLDAFGDGRGFNAEHEKAQRYVEEAVRFATIRRDALERIASWPVQGKSLKHKDIVATLLNAIENMQDLARAALKENES